MGRIAAFQVYASIFLAVSACSITSSNSSVSVIPDVPNWPATKVEPETYTIKVDRGASVEEWFRRGYDWLHWRTGDFLKPGIRTSDEVEIVLLKFDPNVTNISDLHRNGSEFDARSLRPADIPEILALGSQHPELIKKFWIISMAEHSDSSPYWRYPFVAYHGNERILNMIYDTTRSSWPSEIRLAAVRLRKQ